MKLKKLQASFGGLQNETLVLEDGLNILQAPNEGGKSTWSAFLRAMLYGIRNDRSKQGYIAEKIRYQPWSGAAMEGVLELTWQGKNITLRRGPKRNSPFGNFEAVYTGTEEPVPGLTGENCGEVLTGVPREVFERSAFLGQGRAAIDSSPALEARVAALVSSGDEDVSFSQVERCLKDWRNRRQHNHTGLIPKLEGELTALDEVLSRQAKAHRLAQEAQRERDRLQAEYKRLEGERDAYLSRAQAERRRRYDAALAAQREAQEQVDRLEAELNRHGAPPSRETLAQAQEALSKFNGLNSSRQLAQRQAEEAAREAQAVRQAAGDGAFSGMEPEEAVQQARLDAEEARQDPKPAYWALGALAAGVLLLLLPLVLTDWPALVWPCRIAGGVCVLGAWAALLLSLRRQRAARERTAQLLAQYGAETPDDILSLAEAYRQSAQSIRQARRRQEDAEAALAGLAEEQEAHRARLLELVHTFAPAASNVFGASAAISRTLGLLEKRAHARVQLEGANQLVDNLPRPLEGLEPITGAEPRFSPEETAARLDAAQDELQRLGQALATAQGERNSLGDPDQLNRRREELVEELSRRREEYAALSAALEGLDEARAELQARFSPALNRRAGELLGALTGGRYAQVTLTRQFEALAQEAGALTPRQALSLSQGTADQLYLAVRLAVCELALPQGSAVPLVLDDALANFDDERCALALKVLGELSTQRQVLLFTCHSREAALWAAAAKGKAE